MERRDLILKAIAEVRADSGLPPVPEIRDEDLLGEDGLGLDSVDLATVVAQLEQDLRYDPFAHGNPTFQTVGEFVKLYEAAPGG